MRVAIAGFQHETNTFAPQKATYRHFEEGEGWPALTRGAALFRDLPGMNIPLGGFIREANALGLDLVPLLWTAAVPSGPVTTDAYERITSDILDGLRKAQGGYDAIYLDLHGAMVAEHVDDGEGELLARVRALVGPRMAVVVSLDLHANVSMAMVRHATALIGYRTYPHVDMAETGARAARHLHSLLYGWPRQHAAWRQVPFLVPLTAMCTLIEPCQSLYAEVARLEGGKVSSASLIMGFPAADVADCGPSVLAYADSPGLAASLVERIAAAMLAREGDFALPLLRPAEAVRRAMTASQHPVVLADVQDNPGAGGTSDTTGPLQALIEADAQGAVLGLLADGEVAAQAHAAGEGATIDVRLGGKAFNGDPPVRGQFTVECLGDGKFTGSGPFYAGVNADLGPMALLRLGGVQVAVSTRRMQAADQAMFRHLGIEPKEQKILALKSSVHFRADFGPLASEVLLVEAPGAFIVRNERLAYSKLRSGIRLTPLGEPRP